MSGKFCKERHESFQRSLTEVLVEDPGKFVKQEEVHSILNLQNSTENKRMATTAITSAFDSCVYLQNNQSIYECKENYIF